MSAHPADQKTASEKSATQEIRFPDAEGFHFSGPKGWKLFGRFWKRSNPQKASAGTLILVHGYSEHSGRYAEFAYALNQVNIDVWALDLPGHGLSEGRRANIDDFNDYIRSVEGLFKEASSRAFESPVFLFGHSLGGLICVRFVESSPMASKLSRLILASPLLGLSRFPEYVLPVLKLLTHILPNVTLPNKSELGHDILTHDVEKMKAREHDTLMKSQVTIHWVREYLKARALAFQEISKIKIPVSIFQSGDEQVVSRPDTERFYQLLTCQKQIKTYEGFFHELLNEIGRAQVIKEICEYLVSPVR